MMYSMLCRLLKRRGYNSNDYIKVIAGMFHCYFAVVKGEGYGDEIELQYFKGKSGMRGNYWILAETMTTAAEKNPNG